LKDLIITVLSRFSAQAWVGYFAKIPLSSLKLEGDVVQQSDQQY